MSCWCSQSTRVRAATAEGLQLLASIIQSALSDMHYRITTVQTTSSITTAAQSGRPNTGADTRRNITIASSASAICELVHFFAQPRFGLDLQLSRHPPICQLFNISRQKSLTTRQIITTYPHCHRYHRSAEPSPIQPTRLSQLASA